MKSKLMIAGLFLAATTAAQADPVQCAEDTKNGVLASQACMEQLIEDASRNIAPGSSAAVSAPAAAAAGGFSIAKIAAFALTLGVGGSRIGEQGSSNDGNPIISADDPSSTSTSTTGTVR